MTTRIEWVRNPDGTQGKTWNPITGCSHAGSPGCDMCYARRIARRLAGRCGYPEAPHHFDVTLHPDRLNVPLRRKKPTTYFVCSMSDLFHEDVPDGFITHIFAMMAVTHRHTFQVLTKRPRRMLNFFTSPDGGNFISDEGITTTRSREDAVFDEFLKITKKEDSFHQFTWPLPNVWLGVSVENQATADERREYLRQCPAVIKFVSYEPALSAIDWTGWEFVSQIISGGESGPGARPSHPDWHRATRDFCQEHKIAYFMKQWGAWAPTSAIDTYKHKWALTHNTQRTVVSAHGLLGTGEVLVYRVGKKRAGRLLDGHEHNKLPGISPPRTQP